MKKMIKAIGAKIHKGEIIRVGEHSVMFNGEYTVTDIFTDGYLKIKNDKGEFLHSGNGIQKCRWKTFRREWKTFWMKINNHPDLVSFTTNGNKK